MDVLVTCKYEEDLIKNEGARVDTTLASFWIFSSSLDSYWVQLFQTGIFKERPNE